MANRLDWASTHWVEVDLDYADQIAARAEYTLVVIGPPRVRNFTSDALWAKYLIKNDSLSALVAAMGKELKPVGLANGVSFSVSRQRIPIMEIGSELMAYASSQTSMAQVTINRLIADASSFVKKIKENVVPEPLRDTVPETSIDFSLHGKADKWPFGMGFVFYADLNSSPIGKVYLEHCKIIGIGTTIGAGQPVIYEGVQILAHRALEFDLGNLAGEQTQ